MRPLSPPIFPSVTSPSLISACLVLRTSLSLPPSLTPPPSFFLLSFSSLTDRNESPGLLAFSCGTETRKERWRRKKREKKKSTAVGFCSAPLCVQGWRDNVDHIYLCPTNHRMSSEYTPHPPPTHHHHHHGALLE